MHQCARYFMDNENMAECGGIPGHFLPQTVIRVRILLKLQLYFKLFSCRALNSSILKEFVDF